ncbi:hypothetical protein U9M48_019141 [Paspalum notatum var. saurae]|uniref:Uncharacterized protein n=1 Tax=Paspalum notatum var. saurae TaxID=547442 RepID=A0AAQ3WR74_PASNO
MESALSSSEESHPPVPKPGAGGGVLVLDGAESRATRGRLSGVTVRSEHGRRWHREGGGRWWDDHIVGDHGVGVRVIQGVSVEGWATRPGRHGWATAEIGRRGRWGPPSRPLLFSRSQSRWSGGGVGGVEAKRGGDGGVQDAGVAEDTRLVPVDRAVARWERVGGRHPHHRSRRRRGHHHWWRCFTATRRSTEKWFATSRPPGSGEQDAGVAGGAQAHDGTVDGEADAVVIKHAGVSGMDELSDDGAAKFLHQAAMGKHRHLRYLGSYRRCSSVLTVLPLFWSSGSLRVRRCGGLLPRRLETCAITCLEVGD